jgi:hypothetical protein
LPTWVTDCVADAAVLDVDDAVVEGALVSVVRDGGAVGAMVVESKPIPPGPNDMLSPEMVVVTWGASDPI